MNKLKYIFKSILKVNTKEVEHRLDQVIRATGKNKFAILFDMMVCGFRHGGGYDDYAIFGMYDMTEEQKQEIKALPRSLMDALDALKEDHDYLTAGGVFPQELIDLWIEKKKADYQKVHSIPHPAEFSLYYDL